MRSKFRLKDLGTGQRYEYTLVYPQEADSAEKISILAIYGPAVFGSRKGMLFDGIWKTEQSFSSR